MISGSHLNMATTVKKHHMKKEFCLTRARYREGRQLKAVKVYTINQESQYLLVQGVPALGAKEDLLRTFSQHGIITEHRVLDEYPAEEFSEVYLIKYERIQSARVAKRKLDDMSFFGGVLHVCYAPEYETVQETRAKIQERRWAVARRLKQLEAERKKHSACSTSTDASQVNQAVDAEPQPPEQQNAVCAVNNQLQLNQHPGVSESPAATAASNTRRWPPAPMDQSCQSIPYQMNGHTSYHEPYSSYYPYFPPLPPIPMKVSIWQCPPKDFDHARVPSANATLPPWIEQDPYPQHSKSTSWQPASGHANRESEQKSAHMREQSKNGKKRGEDVSGGKTETSEKSIVIKNYKPSAAPPIFVPHQVKTKKVSALSNAEFRQSIKDAVNETLRRNALILDDVKGPKLPPKEEKKRKNFLESDVGDKSMDITVSNIRDKIRQFSVPLIPRQVKKQKTS